MPRRIRKQILYGAFYLLILVIIVGWAYFAFLKPAPSCYDKIKNQDETEVDCGGVCSGICSPIHAKPIQSIGQILTLYPDGDSMSILAQINNPNLNYMANNFTYTFSLYAGGDQPVRTFQGTSFIYPGETKYILVPNVPRVDFSRIDFTAGDMDWVPSGDIRGAPNLTVVGAEMNVKEGKLVIEGTMANKDIVIVGNVTVFATFGGALGQTAGASQTEVTDLSPGETRAFSIVHPNIENIDLTATKIFLYARRQ